MLGMMFAQNSNSKVMKLDKNGKVSFPYSDTNTGGAISMNKKGALFIVQRGLPQEIWQLAPKRLRYSPLFIPPARGVIGIDHHLQAGARQSCLAALAE